jgi:hypothetical protein
VYLNGRLVGYLLFWGAAESIKIRLGKDFVKSDPIARVQICTVAFGMGVDGRRLRNCIIFDLIEEPSILMPQIGRTFAKNPDRGTRRILCPKLEISLLIEIGVRKESSLELFCRWKGN